MKSPWLYLLRSGALLCVGLFCPLAGAVTPPVGTATLFNNIGLFDSSTGQLTSCVILEDNQGKPLVDAIGKPQIYDVVMSLINPADLVFQLKTYTPFNLAAGKDCSGIFKSGIYTDKVLMKYPGLNLDGKVLNVTLDLVNSDLQFKLRNDSQNFGITRNFVGNTTELGATLGDFQSSAVREYGTANLPNTVTLKLPACSDPQGDESRVVIERNGAILATALAGSVFPLSPAALSVGSYDFKVYCSDEASVRTALGTAANAAYFGKSGYAPGTVKITIVSGTSTSPSTTTGPLNFSFDPATGASDKELIQQAAQYARDFMLTTFGRSLQKASNIATSTTAAGCANGGGAAFTGSQNVTFCTANRGWTDHDSINRQKIVIHEMFHLLQFEVHWLGNPSLAGAHWMIEGSAEYFGWLGVASENLLSFDTARGCMLKQVSDFALQQPPGLPALSSLETQQQFSFPGPVYPLAMLAADQLAGTNGVGSLLTYGNTIGAGTAAIAAFQTAFGTSIASFYTAFPAYKAGLTVPSSYACGI